MTDVDALTAFIRARLDDEERDAQAAMEPRMHAGMAGKGIWTYRDEDYIHDDDAGVYVASTAGWGSIEAGHGRHITRQDPAATLARVAALRALVDWAELRLSTTPTDPDDADAVGSAHEDAREVLRYVAAIWRDHPDHRPEWSP